MRALPRVLIAMDTVCLAGALGACEEGLLVPPAEQAGSVQMAFDLADATAAGFAVDQAVITFQRPMSG